MPRPRSLLVAILALSLRPCPAADNELTAREKAEGWQLLFDGRLGVDLKFPGVSRKLNPDPADWDHPEAHSTMEAARGPGGFTLTRKIDDTHYSVKLTSDRELDIEMPAPHSYRMTAPGSTQLTLLVEFTEGPAAASSPGRARTSGLRWSVASFGYLAAA